MALRIDDISINTILGPGYMDVLCYGLTIGIYQSDGSVKEYWIEKINGVDEITVDNFKEKQKSKDDSEFVEKVNKFMDDTNRSISTLTEKTNTLSQRLDAIKEFTELGSGYKIAIRDLSIRGSGDIFGSSQAGFVDSVGVSLYTKMIEDEINREKKEGMC